MIYIYNNIQFGINCILYTNESHISNNKLPPLLPSLTEYGYKLVKLPNKLKNDIKHFYHENRNINFESDSSLGRSLNKRYKFIFYKKKLL